MRQLRYVTKRGKAVGTELTPHKHADGCYVASKTRFEKDYVRVHREEDLAALVQRGYKIRMSNPNCEARRAPSLVIPLRDEN